jgi:integrase
MARSGDAIYERSKRNWYLDCWINGVRYRKHLGKGISRSVALEFAHDERTAILRSERGFGKKGKDLTFNDARKKFEDWVKADKKPNTIRTYTACLDKLAEIFNGKRLSDITPWSLEAYKKRRGVGRQLTERPKGVAAKEWNRRCQIVKRGAPIRANRELAVLKTLYNKCIAWGVHKGENPVGKVKLRKEERTRLRFLEIEEEARLLAATKEPWRSLILIGIHTGLRIQAEALTLRWSSVDLKRATLTVEAAYAKNGRTRTVPLDSVAMDVLRILKAKAKSDESPVFMKDDGSPYRTIGSMFQRACRRANVCRVSPHTLRHTFASRLVMAGVDLRTVQELGGWRTIGMVERYSHLSPQHKAQAIERLSSFYDATHNVEAHLSGTHTLICSNERVDASTPSVAAMSLQRTDL